MKSCLVQILLLSFIILTGCKKEPEDFPEDNNPFKVHALLPLPDNIPYDQLGSGKILFERFYGNSESEFFVIDIDQRISKGFKLESRITQPAISPSGTKLACSLLNSSEPGAAWNIHIMNIDGSDCFPVYKSDRDASFPAWSSDGSKIIYSQSNPGGGIYMQSPVENSPDRVELIKFQYDDAPGWEIKPSAGFTLSQSGMLAGVSTSEILNGLIGVEPYIGKAGARTLVAPSDLNVQTLEFEIVESVYSPDGTKIAFLTTSRNPNENWVSMSMYMVDPDGNNMMQVFGGGSGINRPGLLSFCWSPDGRKFLFTFPFEDNSLHLFVANIDGSAFYQVTNQVGAFDSRVSWCR